MIYYCPKCKQEIVVKGVIGKGYLEFICVPCDIVWHIKRVEG